MHGLPLRYIYVYIYIHIYIYTYIYIYILLADARITIAQQQFQLHQKLEEEVHLVRRDGEMERARQCRDFTRTLEQAEEERASERARQQSEKLNVLVLLCREFAIY
jgi:hypothetical protein